MSLEVKLFAVAKELAGGEVVQVEITLPATVGELRAAMVEQFPPLGQIMGSVLIAVNAAYVDDASTIPSGAEVACIPPVSGG